MNQIPHQTPHQILHQELLRLRGRAKAWLEGEKPDGFDPDLGICSGLRDRAHYRALLDDLLAAWPGGSGNEIFQVPHPTKTPLDAFYDCDEQEMWNPEFEYARNRWALLDWLIEQTSDVQPGDQS